MLTIDFQLSTELNSIAYTINTILLDRGLVFADETWPPCQPNPALDRPIHFAFPESIDSPCSDCRKAKAIAIDLGDINLIPAGAILYSCAIRVDVEAAEGSYSVRAVDTEGSDGNGNVVYLGGASGTIQVRRTRKPSATPLPTRTPIPGEERTRRPSATASPTRATPPGTANAVTPPPSPASTATPTSRTPGDDGCSGGARPGTSLVLHLPILPLLLNRRKQEPLAKAAGSRSDPWSSVREVPLS